MVMKKVKSKKPPVKKKSKAHHAKISSNQSTLERILSFSWFKNAARE